MKTKLTQEQAEQIQNFGEQHPEFHSPAMKRWRKMMKNYTLIGNTKDGVPVYWGKKESDDPTSRDLTLWVAVGCPKYDGSNYRRVPVSDEVTLSQSLGYSMTKWNTWMASRIAYLTASAILNNWTGFVVQLQQKAQRHG